MNTNETPTPPPPTAPDPFEAIAQQLATLAAGLVQIAGQIARLKDGATPPPEMPEPQPEPPVPEESQQEEPPAPEPEEEEQESTPDAPEAAPEGEESPEEQPPAESPANEQEGEGQELDTPPEQPAEEKDTEGEGEGPEAPAEPEPTEEPGEESGETGDGEPQDAAGETEGEESDSGPAETDDAPEGQETTENGEPEDGDGNEGGEESTNEPGESEGEGSAQDGAGGDCDNEGRGAQPEPTADDTTDEERADTEPEHLEEQGNETSEKGGYDGGTGGDESGDDGKGTAAELPPDLPPLDSTLANCAPPPAPEATPYRPLTPMAKKCADILTGALGKRFALPHSDRHTGTLSANAVARHAPDVFRRRPRRDGTRPKLTVLVDTSGSMSSVHRRQSTHLVDGLLEAHRRRVIDLRLYDAGIVAMMNDKENSAGETYAKTQASLRALDKTGMFDEAQAKKLIADAEKEPMALHFCNSGAMGINSPREGFALALDSLRSVIADSDATILLTDGHWTDGALDKEKYTCAGVQVVGLYISLEYETIKKGFADMREFAACHQGSKGAEMETAIAKAEAICGQMSVAMFEAEKINVQLTPLWTAQNYGTRHLTNEEKAELASLTVQHDAQAKIVDKLHQEYIDALKPLGGAAWHRAHGKYSAIAEANARLESNSHRAYCATDASGAAQVIVQEIGRQLASK